MSGYTVKLPITGMPDYTVKRPLKPVRLHLEPDEALLLYVSLEQTITALNKQPNSPEALVDGLVVIADKLHDKLEVSFHEGPGV
jgi:hypothetical protein